MRKGFFVKKTTYRNGKSVADGKLQVFLFGTGGTTREALGFNHKSDATTFLVYVFMYYKRKMRLRVVSVSTQSCGLCPFSPHT